MGWIETHECPHCQSRDIRPYQTMGLPPVFEVDFCNGKIPVQTVVKFVQCGQCQLIIQSPRMSDERLDFYYSSGLYRTNLGVTTAEMDRGEILRSNYAFEWLLPRQVLPVSTHLDIGCSRGSFLKRVGAREKYGYDLNHDYAVEKITVIRNKPELKTYELVTSLHVLEHVVNPQAELRWYKSLSSKWVMIEVPRLDGGLRFPHLFYFPSPVLVAMFERAGMEVIDTAEYPNTRVLAKIKKEN